MINTTLADNTIARMEERSIYVEKISVDDVFCYDRVRYNTNNCYADADRPADYQEVVEATVTSTWIDGFKSYKKLEFSLSTPTTSWLRKAARTGVHTANFPKAYEDEKELLCKQLEDAHPTIFDGTEYFVRTESVSLKYGKHKAGPYKRMNEIIESLVTSIQGHAPITDETKNITLYFIPWENLSVDREYRGFVCNNVLTALSQQFVYRPYEGTVEQARQDADTILRYFHTVMRERITFLTTYTFDIAILEDGSPYFIEMNCFGANYAAGSALFGWLQDHALLTGEHPETLFVRITIRNQSAETQETDPLHIKTEDGEGNGDEDP